MNSTSTLATPILGLLFGLAGLMLATGALPTAQLAGRPGTRRHTVAYALNAHRAGAITLGLHVLAIAGIVLAIAGVFRLLNTPVP